MSDLSLIGGGSDERTEDTSYACLHCDAIVPLLAVGVIWILGEGVFCDETCRDEYRLASQRAMDREAVQG